MNPNGWKVWGNIHVKEIMEVMKLMVKEEEGCERKDSVNTHNKNGKMT